MSNVLREGVRLFVCRFTTDNVFFLESVKDGLSNVFITETSPYKRYPRFSTNLVTMGKSKVGIKMIKINNSRRGDSNTHPQHVDVWRTVSN